MYIVAQRESKCRVVKPPLVALNQEKDQQPKTEVKSTRDESSNQLQELQNKWSKVNYSAKPLEKISKLRQVHEKKPDHSKQATRVILRMGQRINKKYAADAGYTSIEEVHYGSVKKF